MYSDIFCRVYNELGWNYYPEAFAQQLQQWLKENGLQPETSLDLACGTGVLCRMLRAGGIRARGMDFSEGMIAIAREADPEGEYDIADMTDYHPGCSFDLVTCTGDSLNHILSEAGLQKVFDNVYACTNPGGYFIFDILNEREISTCEPFDFDFDERLHVRFCMTRPAEREVNLRIEVWEQGRPKFEENIRETVHDPAAVCRMLEKSGFRVLRCSDRLLENSRSTTWFVIAKKEIFN